MAPIYKQMARLDNQCRACAVNVPTMGRNETPKLEKKIIVTVVDLGKIVERAVIDLTLITHQLETLQRNLDNVPSPCNGRAVAKAVGDLVSDLREAIAPLR